ncbi:hypothetical protein BH23CYA1_BH23CYA1_03410 [soil metagenome]
MPYSVLFVFYTDLSTQSKSKPFCLENKEGF